MRVYYKAHSGFVYFVLCYHTHLELINLERGLFSSQCAGPQVRLCEGLMATARHDGKLPVVARHAGSRKKRSWDTHSRKVPSHPVLVEMHLPLQPDQL